MSDKKDKNNSESSFEDFLRDTIKRYHYMLSAREIDEIRRTIHQRINRKNRSRRLYYWSVAAAASIALLLYVKFQSAENMDATSVEPDITAFAEMSRPETKPTEIHLVLSNEQTVFFDRKETVITYDTTGIVVDKEVIAPKSESTGFNQLIVPLAKRSILNLSDGTKVWVNSDSRLIYPVSFANDKREIYVDGEIYIEVAEETHRPFVVRTKDMDVQVLGTKFNITAYDADQEKKIVLVSGLVQIASKTDNEVTQLHPDEMYYLSENGQSAIEKVDVRKHTSWIDGIYFCENENLGSILQRLSRFYGVEIVCDPSIAEVVYSGKLDLTKNLTDICKGISFTLPVSFSENDGKYIISKEKR